MDLKIEPSPKRPQKVQVKFYCTEGTYRAFKKACEQKDVRIMDAFDQFMTWFIKKKD